MLFLVGLPMTIITGGPLNLTAGWFVPSGFVWFIGAAAITLLWAAGGEREVES
jgi:hypothetical protein